MTQHGYFVQNSRLHRLARPTCRLETKLGGFKGFFSGAGVFVLEATAPAGGMLLIGAFGGIEELQCDGNLVIDTGHLVAWDATLEYTVGKSGSGWIASFLSGEGLVCHFKGQGRIWIQSRNAADVRPGDRRAACRRARAERKEDTPCATRSSRNPTSRAIRVHVRSARRADGRRERARWSRATRPIEMKTQLQGGLLAARQAQAARRREPVPEHLHRDRARARRLWLAPAPEGDVEVHRDERAVPVFLQSGAFLGGAAERAARHQVAGRQGLLQRRGLVPARAQRPGPAVLLGLRRHPRRRRRPAYGYICDTGHIVGFTGGLNYNVNKVGGLKSLFFSGEGPGLPVPGPGAALDLDAQPGLAGSFLHPFRPVQSRS